MGLNLDTTAITPVLKQRYTEKKIETLAFQSALLAKMPKDGSCGGSLYIGAIRNATTTSRSASDATAFTTGSPSVYNQWQCAWKFDFGSGNITGTAIDQAKGDANALVDALTGEFDGVFISLGISAGSALFRNGGGAIGQISATSNPATPTITLTDPSSAVNFMVGMILQTSVTDGTSGAVKAGTVTLTKVDINLGTLTASGNWTAGIGTAAVNDFIFQQGDFSVKLIGLAGWIPDVNNRGSLSTLFNNVDRSTDPARLAGIALDGKGGPKAESLVQLATLVNRMGGRPNLFVCNPLDYADIEKDLGSRVQYVNETAFGNAQIGFPAFKLATAYGNISIMWDVFCPVGTGYLLNTEEWLLPSMGKIPKVLGAGVDGMDWLRVAGADAYQLRAAYRATTYCAAPGHQGVVTF